MKQTGGKIYGPLVLEHDAEIGGMVTDLLVVRGGITLILRGMVTGDLIAEAGSNVEIHGMVNGTVFNEGGNVTIWGKADRLAGSHPCTLAPGSQVGP